MSIAIDKKSNNLAKALAVGALLGSIPFVLGIIGYIEKRFTLTTCHILLGVGSSCPVLGLSSLITFIIESIANSHSRKAPEVTIGNPFTQKFPERREKTPNVAMTALNPVVFASPPVILDYFNRKLTDKNWIRDLIALPYLTLGETRSLSLVCTRYKLFCSEPCVKIWYRRYFGSIGQDRYGIKEKIEFIKSISTQAFSWEGNASCREMTALIVRNSAKKIDLFYSLQNIRQKVTPAAIQSFIKLGWKYVFWEKWLPHYVFFIDNQGQVRKEIYGKVGSGDYSLIARVFGTGREAFAYFLLSHGADPNFVDPISKRSLLEIAITATNQAYRLGKRKVPRFDCEYKYCTRERTRYIVSKLLECENILCDIPAEDDKYTPLTLATLINDTVIMNMLLAKRANPYSIPPQIRLSYIDRALALANSDDAVVASFIVQAKESSDLLVEITSSVTTMQYIALALKHSYSESLLTFIKGGICPGPGFVEKCQASSILNKKLVVTTYLSLLQREITYAQAFVKEDR